jgi:hypothetical protein
MLVALSLNVSAQQPDTRDRTIMTFSNGVELPGLRLEAGTYVFKLADTASRNVIQVFDKDEKDILGQWLFVSAERPEVSGDTVVTFRETASTSTPAVQYWYYPGEKIGKEFIYPKDQAMRIAQRTGVAVMTDEGPVTAAAGAQASTSTSSTQSSMPQAQAEVAPAQESSVAVSGSGTVEGSGLPQASGDVAVGTSGGAGQRDAAVSGSVRQESTMAQADTRANVGNDTAARNELPATASPLALSGLIALFSLAGAASIRAFRL